MSPPVKVQLQAQPRHSSSSSGHSVSDFLRSTQKMPRTQEMPLSGQQGEHAGTSQ